MKVDLRALRMRQTRTLWRDFQKQRQVLTEMGGLFPEEAEETAFWRAIADAIVMVEAILPGDAGDEDSVKVVRCKDCKYSREGRADEMLREGFRVCMCDHVFTDDQATDVDAHIVVDGRGYCDRGWRSNGDPAVIRRKAELEKALRATPAEAEAANNEEVEV